MHILLMLLGTVVGETGERVAAADPPGARAFIRRLAENPLEVNGREVDRVARDEHGRITRIRLDRMLLGRDDFEGLSRIGSLRSVSLRGTNVDDGLLEWLQQLPELSVLNLSETSVTDAAVPRLRELSSLRCLCLGQVDMTQRGVDELKASFDRLCIGYSPNKRK